MTSGGWLRRILVAAYGLGLGALPMAGESAHLVSQLRALGVQFALLVHSQAIDEAPLWSPDGRLLAINLDGKWSRFDTNSLVLRMGTWHGTQTIAVTYPTPALQDISEDEVRAWQRDARFDMHVLTTKAGVTIELVPEGLGTVFRVTSKGREPEVHWRTALENCHSLALSPDQTLVAFLCELNGLVVFAVPP